MSAYLVTVVVTDRDDATARVLAQTIADLAAQEASDSMGDGETYVGDPIQVVRP